MMSSSVRQHLVYNARIWQPECSNQSELVTWMQFNTETGLITATGSGNPPLVSDIPDSQRTDLGGRRILPGLHDSHLHVGFYGESLCSVDLRGCQSINDLQQILGQFIEDNGDLEWITGSGWEQDLLKRYPNRHDLDAVCADKPIYLKRICRHIAVANSLALQLAGKN